MQCLWLKKYASFNEEIKIINNLDSTKFEQVLNRISSRLKLRDSSFFMQDEKQKLEKIFQINSAKLEIALKTTILLCKTMMKYVLKPADLKDDLMLMGLSIAKAEAFVKVWSVDVKDTINELESPQESPRFSWKLNAELSSDICKKSKEPKAYILFSDANKNTEMEFLNKDLYSMFLQIEAIQHELDNIM